VNRLPLDNATLELQHHYVGRAQERQALCLWNQGPRSTVDVSDEKLFGQGLLLSGKMHILQLDAATRSWRAVSHHQKQ